MFGRLQSAASKADAALPSYSNQSRGGNSARGGGAGNGKGIAGSALKRAGLMDNDVGMRSASATGPNRRATGAAGRGLRWDVGDEAGSAGPVRIGVLR